MVIEESIIIDADIEKVWNTFTDLTRWKEWSTVAEDISSDETTTLEEGKKFRFCIRPFSFPVNLEPEVEEVVPLHRIVWAGTKHGIFARHEFLFKKTDFGILVTSRETFSGLPALSFWTLFPEARLRELTMSFLEDLKEGSEFS